MKYFCSILILLFCIPIVASGIEHIAPKVAPLSAEQMSVVSEKLQQKQTVSFELLIQALNDDQTTLRARAANALGNLGEMRAVPYLIDALSDDSGHKGAEYPEGGMCTTRYWANASLKKLTDRDFGFVWDAPQPKREEAIQKWIVWWKPYIEEYTEGEVAALKDIKKGKYIYSITGMPGPTSLQLEAESAKHYGITIDFHGCLRGPRVAYDRGYRDAVIKALKKKYGFDPVEKLDHELRAAKNQKGGRT
ncbi:MAG: HEAT repeat domain-containing protein [Chthoniobacterales bacterium]